MDELRQIKPSLETNTTRAYDEKHESEGKILLPKLGQTQNKDMPSTISKENSKQASDKKNRKKLPKWLKITGIVVLVMILIFVVFGAILGLQGYKVYKEAMNLKQAGMELNAAVNSQNLPLIKEELIQTKSQLDTFNASYKKIEWISAMPYVGAFVEDGRHGINSAYIGFDSIDIVINAVEPYADIIGLNDGSEASSGEETAQDRLDFVVSTIPDLIPKADALSEKMVLLQNEINQIDPERYPEEFQGYVVKENLKKAKELIILASTTITNGKPLLEVAPDLLGTNSPRTYLVIFQNDKELRPTGGFLTAYSIATVDSGKFNPVSSNDIYNIDNRYTPRVPAPDPVKRMLKGPYLLSSNFRLRDMNWSPDFEESMDLFAKEIELVGIDDIDGIIAVDTQVVVNILDVIGQIGVPGFGNFSTENDPRCNCPNVVYELESFADVEGAVVWDQNDPTKIIFAPDNYENRKEIIGPLMNSVLSNALGQSKEKIPALFEAGFNSLMEKHVLVYLFDDTEQQAARQFGIAGKIVDYEGDYLHINDANLGGRKSNLYVDQKVEQEIDISRDGSVTKTVTITYTNTEKHDGWLNSVLPSWLRVYVPEGSELVDMQGLVNTEDPYSELGKTVFAGQYELRPEGVAKIVLTYKLPFKVENDMYSLMIQKQPGTDMPLYSTHINNDFSDELYLKVDKEYKIKL